MSKSALAAVRSLNIVQAAKIPENAFYFQLPSIALKAKDSDMDCHLRMELFYDAMHWMHLPLYHSDLMPDFKVSLPFPGWSFTTVILSILS